MSVQILIGDCREVLKTLPDESVHCCVTSPPYFGLRDYGNGANGIGLESTLDEHMAALLDVFAQVRRVLRADGTLWVNYGDAYAGSWGAQSRGEGPGAGSTLSGGQIYAMPKGAHTGSVKRTPGIKPKDLMGLPWALAFALRDAGWWLRQDIIWHKPSPMPESVTDRCTKAHEYLFLLAKSDRYFYDAAAIKEPQSLGTFERFGNGKAPRQINSKSMTAKPGEVMANSDYKSRTPDAILPDGLRNKRSVWEVATQGFSEAHFATFPPALIEPCILAGCPKGGTVLDPFGGAGTTGLVADRHGRNAILVELNPEYAAMARRRIERDAGMFANVQENPNARHARP